MNSARAITCARRHRRAHAQSRAHADTHSLMLSISERTYYIYMYSLCLHLPKEKHEREIITNDQLIIMSPVVYNQTGLFVTYQQQRPLETHRLR